MTKLKASIYCAAAIAAAMITAPAAAEALRSKVAFNTGIGKKTTDQPANGVRVAYQVQLKGGELDGCNVAIVESLYGRDEGRWGIFDIEGAVSCTSGSFAYASSGAWDGNGFHASGHINKGSGRGDLDGIVGRIAQLGGAAAPAAAGNGTLDVSYELVVDRSGR